MADAKVLVRTSRGDIIGEALVNEDGDIINIEISNALYSRMFAFATHGGMADGLVLHAYFNQGIPTSMTQHINKENNNARTS